MKENDVDTLRSFGIFIRNIRSDKDKEEDVFLSLIPDISFISFSFFLVLFQIKRRYFEHPREGLTDDKIFDKNFFYTLFTLSHITIAISSILVPSILAGFLLSLNFTMIYKWTFGKTDFWISKILISRKMNNYLTLMTSLVLFFVSYCLSIPLVFKHCDKETLSVLGFGYKDDKFEPYYNARNVLLLLYIILFL